MSGDTGKSPDAGDLARAKTEAEIAKKRLTSTMNELQQRLRPSALASDAWSGVKDRGGELADTTIQAVKDRPAAASGIAAAVIIFLARNPLGSLIGKMFSGENNKDLVTTKVTTKDANYDLAAPAVSRSIDEGVNA